MSGWCHVLPLTRPTAARQLNGDPFRLPRRQFTDEGYNLFPLRIGAKTPSQREWQQRDYTKFDFEHWLLIGGNIGLRLGPNDLVIEYDPPYAFRDDDPRGRVGEAVGAGRRNA